MCRRWADLDCWLHNLQAMVWEGLLIGPLAVGAALRFLRFTASR